MGRYTICAHRYIYYVYDEIGAQESEFGVVLTRVDGSVDVESG